MVNKYSHPTLAWIVEYWPVTILMPTVLLLIVVLALVTRWWDKRDAAGATAPRDASSAQVTMSPTP